MRIQQCFRCFVRVTGSRERSIALAGLVEVDEDMRDMPRFCRGVWAALHAALYADECRPREPSSWLVAYVVWPTARSSSCRRRRRHYCCCAAALAPVTRAESTAATRLSCHRAATQRAPFAPVVTSAFGVAVLDAVSALCVSAYRDQIARAAMRSYACIGRSVGAHCVAGRAACSGSCMR